MHIFITFIAGTLFGFYIINLLKNKLPNKNVIIVEFDNEEDKIHLQSMLKDWNDKHTYQNLNYVGMIKKENSEWELGFKPTSDIERLLDWKHQMLECVDVEDCRIHTINEIFINN